MKGLTSVGSQMFLTIMKQKALLVTCMVPMSGRRNGLNLKRQFWRTSTCSIGDPESLICLLFG